MSRIDELFTQIISALGSACESLEELRGLVDPVSDLVVSVHHEEACALHDAVARLIEAREARDAVAQ